MSVFPPWRVARRRGRFLAASIGSLVRSRLHQEHPVILAAAFLAAQPGSRSFPARLVKGSPCRDPRCLPSGDVGAPHLPAEGALPVFRKSRLTTDVDPMGFATLVRRDAALHSNEHHTESCDDDEESPSS